MHDFHLAYIVLVFITHLKMFISLSRVISFSVRRNVCLEHTSKFDYNLRPWRDHTLDKSDENKVCTASIKLSGVVDEHRRESPTPDVLASASSPSRRSTNTFKVFRFAWDIKGKPSLRRKAKAEEVFNFEFKFNYIFRLINKKQLVRSLWRSHLVRKLSELQFHFDKTLSRAWKPRRRRTMKFHLIESKSSTRESCFVLALCLSRGLSKLISSICLTRFWGSLSPRSSLIRLQREIFPGD